MTTGRIPTASTHALRMFGRMHRQTAYVATRKFRFVAVGATPTAAHKCSRRDAKVPNPPGSTARSVSPARRAPPRPAAARCRRPHSGPNHHAGSRLHLAGESGFIIARRGPKEVRLEEQMSVNRRSLIGTVAVRAAQGG